MVAFRRYAGVVLCMAVCCGWLTAADLVPDGVADADAVVVHLQTQRLADLYHNTEAYVAGCYVSDDPAAMAREMDLRGFLASIVNVPDADFSDDGRFHFFLFRDQAWGFVFPVKETLARNLEILSRTGMYKALDEPGFFEVSGGGVLLNTGTAGIFSSDIMSAKRLLALATAGGIQPIGRGISVSLDVRVGRILLGGQSLEASVREQILLLKTLAGGAAMPPLARKLEPHVLHAISTAAGNLYQIKELKLRMSVHPQAVRVQAAIIPAGGSPLAGLLQSCAALDPAPLRQLLSLLPGDSAWCNRLALSPAAAALLGDGSRHVLGTLAEALGLEDHADLAGAVAPMYRELAGVATGAIPGDGEEPERMVAYLRVRDPDAFATAVRDACTRLPLLAEKALASFMPGGQCPVTFGFRPDAESIGDTPVMAWTVTPRDPPALSTEMAKAEYRDWQAFLLSWQKLWAIRGYTVVVAAGPNARADLESALRALDDGTPRYGALPRARMPLGMGTERNLLLGAAYLLDLRRAGVLRESRSDTSGAEILRAFMEAGASTVPVVYGATALPASESEPPRLSAILLVPMAAIAESVRPLKPFLDHARAEAKKAQAEALKQQQKQSTEYEF